MKLILNVANQHFMVTVLLEYTDLSLRVGKSC